MTSDKGETGGWGERALDAGKFLQGLAAGLRLKKDKEEPGTKGMLRDAQSTPGQGKGDFWERENYTPSQAISNKCLRER